jgi:UDP-N-acetylglucosamine--N-acetylmuramyl-(pentapeptide) pyrophosphoryl-undecaprenol N-acetylglucosamine transferase
MKNKLVVLISGGGTGGHIFPAVAIGKAIQAKYPDAQIEFVGAKDKMEMQKVPEAGFKIHGLWISGLQRELTLKNLSFPFKLLSSIYGSWKLIRKIKPHVVIGVGGFASGPLLFVANALKIPTLLQEQNSYPGITNKMLASKANKICVAFPDMDRFFPKEKIVFTGNPLRPDILKEKLSKGKARTAMGLLENPKTILIIGGSLGARTVNRAIEAGLNAFEEAGIQILWQTGKFYDGEAKPYGIRTEFIKDMSTAYDCADLVISRAGALSIAELCAKSKPCILIPSPNVAEDHQTKNAMALVNRNAAKIITDKHAGDELVKSAIELCHDEAQLQALSAAISTLAVSDATDRILIEIESLLNV